MTAATVRGRRPRSIPPPVVVAVFYSALSLAWILGNPAGSAPDEGAHYLKALAVSGGDLAGRRVVLPPPPPGRKEAWIQRTTRAVEVPAGLSPDGLQCSAGRPERSAACQDGARPSGAVTQGFTTVGTAQPTAYLAPGLAARLAGDPVAAMQLGRGAGALLALGLIWAAVALVWDRSWRMASMVGLAIAITPTAVFLVASVTASGLEVVAAVCFFAGLLRVTRQPPPATWTWAALGVSGVALVTSRSLGPLWMALDVTVVVAAHGAGPSWAVLRSAGHRALAAFGAIAVAVALSVGWELAVQPHGRLDLGALGAALVPSVKDLRRVLAEVIGVFGALDSPMPAFAYLVWLAMLAALVLAALRVGRRRDRVVMLALAGGLVVLTVAVAALNLAQTGFGMQGRYVLPMVVTLPLLAGEVWARRPGTAPSLRYTHLAPALVFGVAGVLHAVGWYANARRAAVGTDGSWMFMGSSEWSPAIGWYPLASLVALSVGALVLCAAHAARQPAPLDEAAAT